MSADAEETPVTGCLDVADLAFIVTCVPLRANLASFRTWEPLTALLVGLVVTALLVGYLLLLTERTARIERLVAKRARELNESELRFRHLVDNAGDAFFLFNQEGKILDVNQWACDRLGYTRDELLSMTAGRLRRRLYSEKSGKALSITPWNNIRSRSRGCIAARTARPFPWRSV